MPLFADDFGSVAGCRRPSGLLGSPTCDGPDRHRRVCPGTTESHLQGLARRMDADSRSRCGRRRRAAACRWIGIGQTITSKRAQAEAIMAEVDGLNGNLEQTIEAYNYANIQLEQIEGDLASNAQASGRREEEPRRRPGAHPGATSRPVRQRRGRLDARGDPRLVAASTTSSRGSTRSSASRARTRRSSGRSSSTGRRSRHGAPTCRRRAPTRRRSWPSRLRRSSRSSRSSPSRIGCSRR